MGQNRGFGCMVIVVCAAVLELLVLAPGVMRTSESRTGVRLGLLASLVFLVLVAVLFSRWREALRDRAWVGAVFVVLGTIVGGIVGARIASDRWGPLLHKYSNRGWKSFPQASGQGYFHGKVLVVRGSSGLAPDLGAPYRDFYDKLTDSLVPKNPDEVGTIVYLDCFLLRFMDRVYFAENDPNHQDPIPAYQQACECALIDRDSDTLIAHRTLKGSEPPQRVTFVQGNPAPATGSAVDDKLVAQYLEGLPRR